MMKNRRAVGSLVAATILLAAGCAAPQDGGFDEVAAAVGTRTGARARWNQGSAADREVERHVSRLLERPLNADDAVQVSLLCHPRLQARYEQLGVAQADLVQAGLLRNPVFDALLRWPDHGGGPNVELSVTADFLDLLFLAPRKKVAAAEYERVKLETAGAVVAHAAEVRSAVVELQRAQQTLELRRTVLDAEQAAAETADRLRAAGNISPLDADCEEAMYEQSRADLEEAEADVQRGRAQLAGLMGIADRSEHWQVAERLPSPLDRDEPLAALEARALGGRLELSAAAAEVDSLRRSLGLARSTSLVGGAEVGVDTEREPSGERVTGPSVAVPLPLFDFGQARVASAKHRLREAERNLDALRQQATTEVRAAYARMSAARRRLERFRSSILPLRRRIVEQSQLQYNAMLLGVFELLDAKRQEVEAGRQYIESLADYWAARAELERAVGARLPAAPDTQPTTVPAPAPPAAPSSPAEALPASQPAGHDHSHH